MTPEELRKRAAESNDKQSEILDRFPALMGLDDADRRPIVDELMKLAAKDAELAEARHPGRS